LVNQPLSRFLSSGVAVLACFTLSSSLALHASLSVNISLEIHARLDLIKAAAGLAELASAFPTSGGQYHFAFCVASPRTRVLVAFVTGWISVIAWCLITSATSIYAGRGECSCLRTIY
jgi:amino acid transporter